jgi:hypothetical protein
MRKRSFVTVLAVLSVTPVTTVQAQDGFLFGQPRGQLTLRAGPLMHRAGGDLFDFFQSELTLDGGDFRAPAVGGELALVVHPRVDVAIGVAYSSVQRSSEFREWVDQDDLPIEQTTSLRVTPVTASVRFYPLSRGETISDLAWVPVRTTPYVGGGAGMAWYKLQQTGDFVEETDLSIFGATFDSNGRAPTGHVLAGVDHWFSPRIGANLEGRYTFGSARPTGDFEGWESMDLSGLSFGVGLALRW